MSPSSQQVYASQGQQVYKNQQSIFAEIKDRVGMKGNGVKTIFEQDQQKLKQQDKENILLSSI